MNPALHLSLLLRYDRTFNLRDAVFRSVRPKQRVLDAGCGLGLLSQWALQAGAAEVVAVDLGDLDVARALAKENHFAERIRFVNDDLRGLELPGEESSFDVLLAMIFLNDPRRDEPQSKLVFNLRDRYLAPTGMVVPSHVEYTACACDWPSQDLPTRLLDLKAEIAALEGRYGLRFRSLLDALGKRPSKEQFPARLPDGRLDRRHARLLSEPSLIARMDFSGEPAGFPDEVALTFDRPGLATTVLWTQHLYCQHQLIFANESMSWIENPCLASPKDRFVFALDRCWREDNVLTMRPA